MMKRLIVCTFVVALGCGDDDEAANGPDAAPSTDAAAPDSGIDATHDAPRGDGPAADVGAGDRGNDVGVDAGRDASPEFGRDALAVAPPWVFADACFANLPAAVGTRNIEKRWIFPGNVRLAYVIETGDRLGTSGTKPWALVAFAAAIDETSECVKDPQRLKYTASHHNCADTAEVTANGTTWKLTNPDRETTKVTLIRAGVMAGPAALVRVSCTSNAGDGQCRTGGPCQ